MAAISHFVASWKAKRAFTLFQHWVVLSAECARRFGKNASSMKSVGPQAASRGRPMASYSRFLTVHQMTKVLLFFYYRSILWKFADSLHRCIREMLRISHSPPMVKR